MIFAEYPIIKVYLDDIERLRKAKSFLGLIFLIGASSELILREITDDAKTSMEKLIFKAKNEKKISATQAELFDAIRERRNKYTHIEAERVWNDYFFLVGKDGLLDSVNEICLDDFSSRSFEKLMKLHIRKDAPEILILFQKLRRSRLPVH